MEIYTSEKYKVSYCYECMDAQYVNWHPDREGEPNSHTGIWKENPFEKCEACGATNETTRTK